MKFSPFSEEFGPRELTLMYYGAKEILFITFKTRFNFPASPDNFFIITNTNYQTALEIQSIESSTALKIKYSNKISISFLDFSANNYQKISQ